MGLVFTDPQTIVVNNDWVRKNVAKFGYEVLNCDQDEIISEWCHEDFIIRMVDYSDILWAAFFDGNVVGAGSFRVGPISGTIIEGTQAVLPKFQKRGIYTSVLEHVMEWAGPCDVENDAQQTLEMQRIWKRMQNNEHFCSA